MSDQLEAQRLIDQAWSEGSAQASRICAEEITRLHAECEALRTELATLRAANYETQSLLAGAEAAMTKEAK